MIKIGQSYFNESQIAAIEVAATGDGCHVHLANGGLISENVDADELRVILERGGLFSGDDLEVVAPDFTAKERRELRAAFDAGYLFAAKDKSDHVYAYTGVPGKSEIEWLMDGESDCLPRRLHGDYYSLSFDDDLPLDLRVLFSPKDVAAE